MTITKIQHNKKFTAKFIDELYEWSKQAYGPGMRTEGICKHIEKELAEVRKDPTDPEEWVDIILLALNGIQRLDIGGEKILDWFFMKVDKNVARKWPDWRTMDENVPIEHKKDEEDDLEKSARELFTFETDNHPYIHTNRFPAWHEFTSLQKEPYYIRARNDKS